MTRHHENDRRERRIEALDGVGEKRRGSTAACDMRVGPCACGAWHDAADPGRTLLEALWDPARERATGVARWTTTTS